MEKYSNSEPNKIKAVSNISSKSDLKTNENISINKLTQTPENILAPNSNNSILSPIASLGKLIDEKYTKGQDLQIGDIVNCIGEFLKKNQRKNGWVLLEFPIQPIQMALLEYKLTGKSPPFGKEINEHSKEKSSIIPEYRDNENLDNPTNTYLSICIKITKNKEEFNSNKHQWNNFLQFYKRQNCIQILVSQLNSVKDMPRKAADILIGLILNEKIGFKTKEIYKLINIFNDNENESVEYNTESDDEDKQINNEQSSTSIITIDNKTENQITNKFQLMNIDLIWNDSHLTDNTALYLYNMWKTMEKNYSYKIKELLNFKHNFFKEVKTCKDLIDNTVNEAILLQNPCIMKCIHKYETKLQNLHTNKTTELEQTILELQNELWEQADNEFQQITQFSKHIIDDQWIVAKNNTLTTLYQQLLETELKRAITTFKFLNIYYGTNEFNISEFNICRSTSDSYDTIDGFYTFCEDTLSKFKKYVYDNYEVVNKIDQNPWIQSVLTEKNRFINQVHRIKASMLLDKIYYNDLTRMDHLENIRALHQFKTNDINKLCELLKYAADAGKSITNHIKQLSGKFCINELNLSEITFKQIFQAKENFNMNQLKTIVNKLLDNAPTYKISIIDLAESLNELSKTQNIHPKKWPINEHFYHIFTKELLGSKITTIDWRDFVVQCMELPYPTTEQLIYYRNLFQADDFGDETVIVEDYERIKLWFDNESNRYIEAKWLLYKMYKVKNRLNYSPMLLAFCRDKQPWVGLGKSFSLIFGWNPFDLKKPHINQFNYHYEEPEIDVEDVNSDIYSSNLFNQEFVFDKNTMTWFLLSSLKLYMNNEKQIGNIDISQLVNSVFEHIQMTQSKPKIINLFQNNIMEELYNTVYKFQIKDFSKIVEEIVKNII